ncbi:type III pantothenate kinase [Xylanibacter muris]|uniref:Type III pantothenate kinase n=1 Tax=Xylanibacter muris TaxID=2736290 RepID=A0ABX2AMV4_9BACT|nr:type III pantothenate kinase [Xylanibacter muris]NPD91271.1 type III pantothenate kinase [Xylanibacter muris]
MKLTIDIGNTCTKLVAFNGLEALCECRTDTDDILRLKDFCSLYPFESGIMSSVIPVSHEMDKAISALPFNVMRFRSGVTPLPIVNMYSTPLTLGSDRIAAAVGAYMKHEGSPVLVIDVGTCITYDFVNERGEYLGGNISPGPKIRFRALHEMTAALPLVDRRGDLPETGYSTDTAIRSGVLRGIEYEIEGYIRDFLLKYPGLFIYLTGGVQLDLHISEKKCIFADKFIVPEGLNRILLHNEALISNEKNNI